MKCYVLGRGGPNIFKDFGGFIFREERGEKNYKAS